MRKSKNYVMTVYPNNSNSLKALYDLRKEIKEINKKDNKKLYVKCCGRLGKNNKFYNFYKHRYNYSVKLEHATRWDVYVYDRNINNEYDRKGKRVC